MQSQVQSPIQQGTGTTAQIDPRLQELHALQAATSPFIAARYPDIVQMLFETPSLTFQEKQYWLRLLPLMTLEQVDKLRGILSNERQKLIQIQQQYASSNAPLTFGDTKKVNYEVQKEKKEMLKEQEHVDQRVEEEHEAALLDQLDEVA